MKVATSSQAYTYLFDSRVHMGYFCQNKVYFNNRGDKS